MLENLPRYCIYLLIIFPPLVMGAVQPWAVTAIHLITLVAVGALFFQKEKPWGGSLSALDWTIIAAVGLVTLSTLFSTYRYASFWSLILFINYVLVFYLTRVSFQTRRHLRELVWVMLGMATFLSIIGLLKRFDLCQVDWWDYSNLKNQARLSATYVNPNHMAGFLGAALPLSIGFLFTGSARQFQIIVMAMLMLISVALALTLSRGGWVGTFGGLIVLAIVACNRYNQRKLLLAILVGCGVITLTILSSTDVVKRIRTIEEGPGIPSFASRVTIWQHSVAIIGETPWLGTGPATYQYNFTRYQPPGYSSRFNYAHNEYIQIIAEVGWGGIGIFAFIGILFYYKGFQRLKSPSRLVFGTTAGVIGSVTSVLVHNLAEFNFHIPANTIIFCVVPASVFLYSTKAYINTAK